MAVLENDQIKYINKVLKELSSESDRASAILLGAEIDSALRTIIEKYLLEPLGNSSQLLEQDAVLGSFSAKIEICYRLGLISKLIHRELHLIRKIRNKFAHHTIGISFDTQPVKDWVSNLKISQWVLEGRRDIAEDGILDSKKDKFILSGATVITLLTSLGNRIQKVKEKEPEIDGCNSN